MKRNPIMVLLALLLCVNTQAQFITTLIVSATPPSTLTQWAGKKEVLGYLVVAQSPGGQPPKPVLIKTEIKTTGGTVVAITDLSKARQYTFRIGNNMLDASDVLPLDNMIFNGKYKAALARTGKLLSDNYEICVQLVDPLNYAPVSEIKCRTFFVASLQLPVLMKPYNEETMDAVVAQTAVLFRWTPPSPKPQTVVKYRLQVFEIMPGQNPVQAMRSNFPVLDKELPGITQYTWQPQGIISWSMGADSFLQPAKFVWTVQSTDAFNVPLGDGNVNGDGRSEPQVFFVNPVRTTALLRQAGDTGKPLTSAPTFGPGNTPHLRVVGDSDKVKKPGTLNPPPTVPPLSPSVPTPGGGSVPGGNGRITSDTGKKPLTSVPTTLPTPVPQPKVTVDTIKNPPKAIPIKKTSGLRFVPFKANGMAQTNKTKEAGPLKEEAATTAPAHYADLCRSARAPYFC